MADNGLWSVDKLAAGRLIAELELDVSDTQAERIARHFSEHRHSMLDWAAERVHSNIIQSLEATSATAFSSHSEPWTAGFCHAEQLIATTHPRELLDLEPPQPRSAGQFLRTMVRDARRSAV